MTWITIKCLALLVWLAYVFVGFFLLKHRRTEALPRGQKYFFGLVYLLLLVPLSYLALFIIMFGYNS